MTTDDFFHNLPPEERSIALLLRQLILDSAPDFTEKFSYGVPYYFRHSRVFCIWPASSAGGPKKGVFLGICRGHLMSNAQQLIEMADRKQFGLIRLPEIKDVKTGLLQEIISEAIMVDEEWFRAKKKKNGARR